MSEITVGEAIDHLRAELTAARDRAAADVGVRFELGDITMEFTVELRREATAKGSVKAWVVSGEAGATSAETSTHRLSFTMRPVDPAGQSIRIANPEAPTAGLTGDTTNGGGTLSR
ncbi:trypco2 family protein [Streptomyces tanashiensis]|uniref:trypco2 family protein n=1 Tax=Streptomyces tanashiensis TaxID=67367 RepID=UPI0033D79D34